MFNTLTKRICNPQTAPPNRRQGVWRWGQTSTLLLNITTFLILLHLACPTAQAQSPGGVSSNLRLWHKADAGSSTTTDGANVTSWTGNSIASTGTATYKAVGFNYNPAMTFNGSSDAFTFNTGTPLISTGSQSFNIFAVYKTNSGVQQHTILGPLNGATVGNIQYRVNGTGGNVGKVLLSTDGVLDVQSLSTSTTNIGATNLSNFIRSGTTFTHFTNFAFDGSSTITNNFSNLTNLNYAIGKAQTGIATDGEFFGGDIAEVIFYDTNLASLDRAKVHTYLAIKYGMAFNGLNYTNSAGTIVWNTATGAGFGAGLIGVGKDTGSGLDQKQSKSVSQNDIIRLTAGNTIATDNVSNTATIANNEFYFASNDDGTTSFATANTFTNFGLTHRMNRVWQVQKTGFAMNDVKIYMDITGLGYTSTNMADYSLVLASNAGLNSTTINIAPNAMTGNVLEFYIGGSQMIPMSPTGSNTYYFTMGYKLPAVAAPASVSNNLRLWYKADAGSSTTTNNANVTTWTGNSIAGTGSATYKAVGINYNPSMSFNGTSDAFTLNTGTPLISTGSQNFSIMAVYKTNTAVQQHTILGPLNGLTTGNIQYRVNNGLNAGKVHLLDDGLANINSLSTSTNNINALRLSSFVRNGTTFSHFSNGSADGSNTFVNNFSSLSNLNYAIGKAQTGSATDSEFFGGDIAEVIFYDNNLSATDRQKLESYLAIKYGITMAQNYVLSDGAKIAWDVTTNAAYNNNIAIIARDDAGNLNQKQSKSQNPGSFVFLTTGTSVLGSNSANAFTFGSDLSRIGLGDNGASATFASATTNTAFAGYNKIMARQWMVQSLTPTARNFSLEIDLAGLGYTSTTASDYKVVISLDGVYDGVGEALQTTMYAGNKLFYTNGGSSTAQGNNPTNFYLAILYNAPAPPIVPPAGVGTGLSFWVKGDAGITASGNNVSQWADQTGNATTEASIAPSADITVNATNFNPSVNFSGASGKRLAGISSVNFGANPLTMFVVAKDEGITQNVSGLFTTNDPTLVANNANGQGIVWTPSGYVLDGIACVGSPTTSPINRYRIVRGAYNVAGNTTGGTMSLDGKLETTSGACGNAIGVENNFEIGGRTLGSLPQRVFKGTIGEVAVYNQPLMVADIAKIESHLAIKYGITLDQTTATNYVLSDGTVIWDATTAGAYNKNIFGIVRDDAGNLVQKQSQSVNTNLLSIANGSSIAASNSANMATLPADKNAFMVADNGASVDFASSVPFTSLGSMTNKRMNRIFKVQSTSAYTSTFTTALEFDLTGLGYTSTNPADYKIAFGFSDVGMNRDIAATSVVGNKVLFKNIDMQPGGGPAGVWQNGTFFFTLAYNNPIAGPAAVNNNLQMWLKADAGTSTTTNGAAVSSWGGQGGTSINATQAINSSRPVYAENYLNFNPALVFNGADSYFNLSTDLGMPLGSENFTIFAVVNGVGNNKPLTILGPDNGTGIGGLQYRIDAANASPASRFRILTDQNAAGVNITGTTTGNTFPAPARLATVIRLGSLFAHYLYGKVDGTGTTSNAFTPNTSFFVGASGQTVPDEIFNGNIHELIVYNTSITGITRDKVHSHLAIKYGMTLDQTTATNYILSDGLKKAWSATGGGIYNKNITVIARDDAGKLNQKQSRSINADGIVTLTTGTAPATSNVANTNEFGADGDRIAIGDNGASASFASATILTGFAGVDRLSAKQWKAQKMTTVGRSFAMEFDLTGLGYTATDANNYKVIVSFDGVYDGTNDFLINTTLSGNTVTWTNPADVNPANDEPVTFFFALAYKNPFDLATVNWDADATNDGRGKGTLGGGTFPVAPVEFVSQSLGSNGGTVFTTNWTTNACTNGVIGVDGVNVVKEAIAIDWSNGAQNYNNVNFGGYILTDPFLFFNFTNPQPFQITFPVGTVITLLDQNPSGVVITSNVISVPAATDFANTGFAIKLTGVFERINFVTNSNNSDAVTNSIGFTVGVETNKITAPAVGTEFPGGVGADLALWVKANKDVTGTTAVTAWKDQSSGANLTASGATSPALATNSINFNPTVNFNGTSHYMDLASGILGTDLHEDLNVYVVNTATGFQSSFLYRESVAPNTFNGHRISMHLPWGNGIVYADAGSSVGDNRLATPTPVTVNTPYLWSALYGVQTSPLFAGTKQDIVRNGKVAASDATAKSFTGVGKPFRLGTGNEFGDVSYYHKGNVAEMVMYTGQLSPSEHNRIESYLALKYGITLDQTAPRNYVFSNDAKMWDASIGGAFNKDIAGIARDDKSGLMQIKSKSIHGDILTVNNHTASTLPTNLSAFTWAHNGASISMDVIAGTKMHMNRVWKIQDNATFGNLEHIIPATTGALFMLVDADGDFSAGATVVNAVTNGTDLVFTGNVANGQYITFAINKPANVGPGGVTTGVTFWLTGGQGITASPTVTGWEDQTGGGKNATGTAGSNPTLVNPKANFNPGLEFDGTKKLVIPGGILGTTPLNDLNFFAVSSANQLLPGFLFKENITGGERISAHVPWNNAIAYYDVSVAASRIENVWGGLIDIPNVWAFPYSTTSTFVNPAHKQNIVRDGLSIVNKTATVNPVTGVGGDFEIGLGHAGVISEIFAINRVMTAGEALRINSYLALKYGITLNQTTPTNYVASDGTTLMWNSASTGAYNRDIAGIGRDDKSALAQKQSRSVNTGSMVAMYLGDVFDRNSDNTFGFPADRRFLVWANDNGSPNFANITTTGLPAGVSNRMTRIWRTEENNGDVGNTYVEVDMTGLGFPALGAGSYKLLVSNSANFATATVIPATAFVGGKLYFADVNLGDDQFFTIGYNTPKAPGGVVNALSLWIKADNGALVNNGNVEVWADQAKGNLLSQYDSNGLPTYNANVLNYNPAIQFNGVNQALRGASIFGTTVHNNVNVYQVITTDAVKNSFIYRESVTPSRFSMHLPWSNGNYYFDAGAVIGDNRLEGAWGGTVGKTHLWSSLYAVTGTTPIGNKQRMVRDGLSIGTDATATAITGTDSAFELGAGDGQFHNGKIGEMIIYTGAITGSQHNSIQSYLALKYGITLDQTFPNDYRASDGTTSFFDAFASGAYKFDIAGIARDDASDLMQKQSRSVNEGGIVAVGLGAIASSNATNTGNLPTNLMSLMWAHNNLATTMLTTQLPAGIDSRMTRVWRVEENNGETGTTEVAFDFTGIAGYNTTASEANYFLLISSNGTDFSGATVIASTGRSGKMVRFTGVNLNDGQFFTVGYNPPPTPGNVSGVGIWTGVVTGGVGSGAGSGNPDEFTDKSNGGAMITPTGSPVISTSPADLVNFNKSPKLSGNETFITDFSINAGANPQLTVIGVHKPTTGGAGKGIWGEDDGGWDRLAYDSKTSTGSGATANVTGFMVDNKTSLGTVIFDEDVANGSDVFVDGKSGLTFSANHAPQTSGGFVIGNVGASANFGFIGYLPEVITFNKKLTTVERNKIESYFAIKYGITLDQTPAQSYFASDWNGTTGLRMWDATASGVYNKDIAGVARDDKGALYQKQARSVNAGEIVTIGLGNVANSNEENTNLIGGDKRFLVWGNNGAGKDFASATYLTNLPTEVEYRMTRVWRVEENNGEVGNVAVWFDINGLGYPSADALNYKLLVSNDGANFSTATIVNADSFVGGIVKFSGVNLNDGQFFTFAYDCQLSSGTIAGTQIICNGTAPATFTSTALPVGSSGVNVSYKWQRSNDNGTTWTDIASANAPTYTSGALANATQAPIQVWFRRMALGCNDRPSAHVVVTVNPTLTPTINITSVNDSDVRPTDGIIDEGGTVNLVSTAANTGLGLPIAVGTVAVTYQWKVDGNNVSGATSANLALTDATLIATAGKKAKYNVTVQITTNYPCATVASVETNATLVQVVRPLEMPDVFTPNKDGKNDVFDLLLGVTPINAKLTIVDLRNNTVYESSNVNDLMTKGWDGTMKNDGVNLAPSHVRYAWFLSYETPTGKSIKEKGYINIQR